MNTPIENLKLNIEIMQTEIHQNDQVIDNVKNRIFELELRNKELFLNIQLHQVAIMDLTK
jgi:hypothetical protein